MNDYKIISSLGQVLFTPAFKVGNMKECLELARRCKAELNFAYLRCVNLSGADLAYSDFTGSDFTRTNLDRASLVSTTFNCADLRDVSFCGSDLRGANFCDADLRNANFKFADIGGADFRGAVVAENNGARMTLVGPRPILQIGPIGSRDDQMIVFLTDQGALIQTGCFLGFLSDFEQAVIQTHGKTASGKEDRYCKEYLSAIELAKAHEKIWSCDDNTGEFQ